MIRAVLLCAALAMACSCRSSSCVRSFSLLSASACRCTVACCASSERVSCSTSSCSRAFSAARLTREAESPPAPRCTRTANGLPATGCRSYVTSTL